MCKSDCSASLYHPTLLVWFPQISCLLDSKGFLKEATWLHLSLQLQSLIGITCDQLQMIFSYLLDITIPWLYINSTCPLSGILSHPLDRPFSMCFLHVVFPNANSLMFTAKSLFVLSPNLEHLNMSVLITPLLKVTYLCLSWGCKLLDSKAHVLFLYLFIASSHLLYIG